MLDKFWETLGQEMAQRWLDHLFGPAFLFWAGGLGLYIWRKGRDQVELTWDVWKIWQHGLDTVKLTWNGWEIHQQAAVILVALLAVFLSSLAVQTLQLPAIRLLEGYWPWPLKLLGPNFISRNRRVFVEKSKELQKLKAKEISKSITAEEQARLSQLEIWAHRNPATEKDLLPTCLGNLIRAREMASHRKYGLDSLVCWPRIWCLLPECLKGDLTSSRAALNHRAELWLWGLLFLVWTALRPLAVLISLAWMLLAYRLAMQAAEVYGDLVETAFDLHRFALYDALAWPRPRSNDEEKASGKQLTEFLWRGTHEGKISYKIPVGGGK